MIITALLSRKAEGTYWDFKRQHHTNNADLIHDVLCLANANHRGDRFLIFGVDGGDFSLHPMNSDAGRRTQADIACLFRSNAGKFFQSRFPEFYLEEIVIRGTSLDVLVIKDAPYKPFYLVERLEKIRAHHIYTRVCDTNTPVDNVAQPHEIERMWRERFGLDMSPLEKVKLYLNDPSAWQSSHKAGRDFSAHHTTFPEFTLKVTGAEAHVECHEEWTRGEIYAENNHAGHYEIYYHQTCIARVRYVSFDDHKKSMVAPNWEPRGAGCFYFYEADSINYALQKYHSNFFREDHSTTLSIRDQGGIADKARSRWGCQMSIPVLHGGELDDFLGPNEARKNIEPSSDEAEQYELFLQNQLEFDKWRSKQNKN